MYLLYSLTFLSIVCRVCLDNDQPEQVPVFKEDYNFSIVDTIISVYWAVRSLLWNPA